MAAVRRRSESITTTTAQSPSSLSRSNSATPISETEPPLMLAPPKLGVVFAIAALAFGPFFYLLLVHYDVDPVLKRSIVINSAMSFGGFIVSIRLIPVAAWYLSRRSMFGYDINKKGTPAGKIKV